MVDLGSHILFKKLILGYHFCSCFSTLFEVLPARFGFKYLFIPELSNLFIPELSNI